MKITDINGENIKISTASITVKNPETGKTCGVIRGCELISSNTPLRELFNLNMRLKSKGLNVMQLYRKLVKLGSEYYFLHNKSFRNAEKITQMNELADKCRAAGITVIECRYSEAV